jgi:hypothetical protein
LQPLPAYVTMVVSDTLKIAPVTISALGTKTFVVTLSDGYLTSQAQFTVEIGNTAPYFVDKKTSDQIVRLNNTLIYYLPEMRDD